MKLKRMWIPLIPTMLMMAGVKVYQQYIEYKGEIFEGKENVIASYATVGIVFLAFLILLVMYIANRKTSPVYNFGRNISAGAVCLFAGSVAVVDLGCYMPGVLLYGEISPLVILNMIFAAIAAFGLYLMCWAHISADKPPKSVSILMLGVPFWCVIKLTTSLLHNSTVSVVLTDTLQLFIYMFLAMFMFSAISMLSILNARNPVKGIMLYGIPLIAVVFTFDVSVIFNLIFKGYQSGYYLEIISAVELTLFAIYAFLLMREVTKNSVNKEDIRLIENAEELEEIVEKVREERIKDYEEKRNQEREKGNFYITDKNEYGSTDNGHESQYGYYGRRTSSYGTYGKYSPYVRNKTYLSDGSYVADKTYLDDNGDAIFISEESELLNEDNFGANNATDDEALSRIDELILEITSGDNDLDMADVED